MRFDRRSWLLIPMVVLLACGGRDNVNPAAPEVLTSRDSSSGRVAAHTLDYVYGAGGVGAAVVRNVPGFLDVRFDVSEGPESGAVHLALFEGEPPVLVASATQGYVRADRTLTIGIMFDNVCGHTYRWDAGLGEDPPEAAAYTPDTLVNSGEAGTFPCSPADPTPTPAAPTPTPCPADCGCAR